MLNRWEVFFIELAIDRAMNLFLLGALECNLAALGISLVDLSVGEAHIVLVVVTLDE